jgi:hypothetical protein
MTWDNTKPIHDCSVCGYPYQGNSCPNPGCDLNLSDKAKAERAERKRLDDEWTANFRRFYHRKKLNDLPKL